jgi:FKBP-type peptidyl-prolyl cis-trans isomerase (trigger factor)
VEPEDDVTVHLLGYAAGRYVPMSAKENLSLDDTAEVLLPGLRAQLDGKEVGGSHIIRYAFPNDHFIEAFRSKVIVYAADIVAASAPLSPEEGMDATQIDAENFQDLPGINADLLETVRNMIRETRRNFAGQIVLDALMDELEADLAPFDLPKALVDAELSDRWDLVEGRMLKARGVPTQDQLDAREFWVNSPDNRAQVESHLRRAMLLAVIARDNQEAIGTEHLLELPRIVLSGEDVDRRLEELDQDKKSRERLVELSIYHAALRYLISTVEVRMTDTDGTEERIPLDGLLHYLKAERVEEPAASAPPQEPFAGESKEEGDR